MKITAILCLFLLTGCATMGETCSVNYNINLPPLSEGKPQQWKVGT